MNSNNNVILVGRLQRDPEERQVQLSSGGEARVKEFLLVVDNSRGGTSYFPVSLWDEAARDFNAKQGAWVEVEGELKQDRWKDKETDQWRSRVQVQAEYAQELELSRKPLADQRRNPIATFHPGEEVQIQRDVPDSGLLEGQVGKVELVNGNAVTVKFEDGSRITLAGEDMGALQVIEKDVRHDQQQKFEQNI